jgi:hypothetical protein
MSGWAAATLSAVVAAVFVLVVMLGDKQDRLTTGDPCPVCGGTMLPHPRYPYETVVCRMCRYETVRDRK